MKRWMIFLGMMVVAGLMLRLPHPATDLSELEPVEVVLVRQAQNGIEVETDTGAIGRGADLTAAVDDLEEHSMGKVFLDTADYLLLELNDTDYEQFYSVFRPGCHVCLADGVEDLSQAGVFLQTHKPQNSLIQIQAGERMLEELVEKEGELELVKP